MLEKDWVKACTVQPLRHHREEENEVMLPGTPLHLPQFAVCISVSVPVGFEFLLLVYQSHSMALPTDQVFQENLVA